MKFFFHRHSESTEYTVLCTRRCKGKIKSIVYHPTQEFHQPVNVNVHTFAFTLHCTVCTCTCTYVTVEERITFICTMYISCIFLAAMMKGINKGISHPWFLLCIFDNGYHLYVSSYSLVTSTHVYIPSRLQF